MYILYIYCIYFIYTVYMYILPVTKCLCVFDPLKTLPEFLAACLLLFRLQVVQQEGGKFTNCRVKMKKTLYKNKVHLWICSNPTPKASLFHGVHFDFPGNLQVRLLCRLERRWICCLATSVCLFTASKTIEHFSN